MPQAIKIHLYGVRDAQLEKFEGHYNVDSLKDDTTNLQYYLNIHKNNTASF